MFTDIVKLGMQGFVKIIDKDTKEVLVDTHNDILYSNMSVALAHTLIGDSGSFLAYMAFGDGAAYVNTIGEILYKPSIGTTSSTVKNPTANLYHTTYVKKISNDSTSDINYDPTSFAYIPAENYSTNYEDIIADVTIGYSEPPAALSSGSANTITINEIGLFSGTTNLFVGNSTQTLADVAAFESQTPNFSNLPGSKSKLMLTHVVFNPITKSAIRSLEIIYTLRIIMSAL